MPQRTTLTELGETFAQMTGDARYEAVLKSVVSAVHNFYDLGEHVQGSQVFFDVSAEPHATSMFSQSSYCPRNALNVLQQSLSILRCKYAP